MQEQRFAFVCCLRELVRIITEHASPATSFVEPLNVDLKLICRFVITTGASQEHEKVHTYEVRPTHGAKVRHLVD